MVSKEQLKKCSGRHFHSAGRWRIICVWIETKRRKAIQQDWKAPSLEGAAPPDHNTIARFRSMHLAMCQIRILQDGPRRNVYGREGRSYLLTQRLTSISAGSIFAGKWRLAQNGFCWLWRTMFCVCPTKPKTGGWETLFDTVLCPGRYHFGRLLGQFPSGHPFLCLGCRYPERVLDVSFFDKTYFFHIKPMDLSLFVPAQNLNRPLPAALPIPWSLTHYPKNWGGNSEAKRAKRNIMRRKRGGEELSDIDPYLHFSRADDMRKANQAVFRKNAASKS